MRSRRSTRSSMRPVVRMDVPSAEMVKLAANAYLATRICFINEIANVCELVGADVEDVARGMGLDRRIGTHYLRAGLGFGGSCFPKDISFLKLLAGNSGYHFHLVTAVMEVNELQMRRPVAKLQKHLGSLRGKRIALLGLAFKPDTDDLREAPSLVLDRAAPGRGRRGRRLGPGRRRACDAARRRVRRLGGRCARAAPTPRSSSPNGRSFSTFRGRSCAARCATRSWSTGETTSTPPRCAPHGFAYEGMGRAASPFAALAETRRARVEASTAVDGGDRPGGREGRASRRRGRRPSEVARRRCRQAARRVPDRPPRGRRRRARDHVGRRRPGRRVRRARWPGSGAEIVCAEEPERLGRGGGIKFAAQKRGGGRRRARDERRRARRRRLRARCSRGTARPARRRPSPSRGPPRRSASSS